MENYFLNPYSIPTFLSAAVFLLTSLYRVIGESGRDLRIDDRGRGGAR